jgi:hypothetical protein
MPVRKIVRRIGRDGRFERGPPGFSLAVERLAVDNPEFAHGI